MDITITEEYFVAQQFINSNDKEEITCRFAELLIKINEVNRELCIVKTQLNDTAKILTETIKSIHNINTDKGPLALSDVIAETLRNIKKESE